MRAEVMYHPIRIVRLLDLLVPSCRDAASVAEAVRIVITAVCFSTTTDRGLGLNIVDVWLFNQHLFDSGSIGSKGGEGSDK